MPSSESNNDRNMSAIEFKRGDSIVAKNGAFVKLLRPGFKDKFCDNCFGSAEKLLLTCSGCGLMKYCNRKCQHRDWKEAHQLECKSTCFKTVLKEGLLQPRADPDPEELYWIRIILRLLSKYHLHPSAFNEKLPLYDGTTRSFVDMMDHVELVEQSAYLLVLSEDLVSKFKNEESGFGAVDFDAVFIRRLMGIWNINMFQILNADNSLVIGGGLYILHSALDHSCRPNATVQRHENGYLEVRCIHPIAKGEKALVSYLNGDGYLTLEKRRSSLMKNYNFKCECQMCRIEESTGSLIDYDSPILKLGKEIRVFTGLQEIVNARDLFVSLAKKIYYEHDERITTVRMYMHYVLVNNAFEKSKSFLFKETTEMENCIIITHGKGSPQYRQFVQQFLT